ncbi:transmembrane and coiled-coil domain-containing protein 4 isoform X2 [Heliangelus exortis]|uniref:transmembrane and coiled-coil domain-containing protein 4 isoform X2 n=1 Tax=Heliangelus exortis TaxID=472823 RepID=UPI003A92FC97
MAAGEKWQSLASKQPGEAKGAGEEEARVPLGQQLGQPGRFACAALCGISLAWLFPGEEQSSFRTDFIEGFVKWLDLPGAVLPAMTAFASGLGGEGTETFAEMLLKDPFLRENPVVITQDLLSFSLRDGYYDARARVLICHITWLLRIPLEELEALEESLVESLKEQKEEESENAELLRKKKERTKKLKRYLLIGLATVGGGTAIGLTGGLAAPLVAAGAAAVIGSAGAAALGSTAGIAVMASLFGAAGAGLTGSFTAPWSSMLHSSEQYCLAWESKYLMELGNALDSLLNGFMNLMAQEALKFTVLSGIMTALTWPASLLTVSNVIDNPWGVCLRRSAEVGKHLARILLSRQQGKRPVSLIGFSLGARVIYFCLQEMAQEEDSQGIIEDVVLLGAPVEGEAKHWKALMKVVSGRIMNGYCRGDWLLRFVYRTSSVQIKVAGLQPVDLDDRRMANMDLSSVVNSHLDYMKQMDIILKAVGIKTKDSHLEEKGSSGLSFPLSKKSQQAAGSQTGKEANSVQEEDVADVEALPAIHTHHQDSPSCLQGGTLLPCPDYAQSREQAAGEGVD